MQRNLDIDLLRAFVAVWEANSFTKASERLFRTQAAISMQIKRLEEQVGKSIFLRERQGLTLTEDGELLISYARKILKLNDEALTTLDPLHCDIVRIGTHDGFATTLLPTVLSHFGKALPSVRTEIICGNSTSLVQRVATGDLDLAVVSALPRIESGGEIIRMDQLFWVMAENSMLQDCDPLPLALFPTGCVCRDAALRVLRSANRPWKLVLESSSVSTLLAAVSAGLAITVMEDYVAPPHSRRFIEFDGLPKLDNVHLTLYRRSDELSKGAKLVANYLATYLRRAGRADDNTGTSPCDYHESTVRMLIGPAGAEKCRWPK